MIDNKAADQLILATAAGDMAAFERLYGELSRAVYAFANSIVKNDVTAQDVMQDTFVRVYNSASGFRASGYGKAWVMQIARNLSLNAITRRVNEPEDEIAEYAAPDSTENAAMTRLLLSQALDALDEQQRQVITLHAVSGLKLSEIAQVLNEPLGTVKWRHAQALKIIRTIINEETEADR